jgi:hypothetical protein
MQIVSYSKNKDILKVSINDQTNTSLIESESDFNDNVPLIQKGKVKSKLKGTNLAKDGSEKFRANEDTSHNDALY